jgi:hypothetical protein
MQPLALAHSVVPAADLGAPQVTNVPAENRWAKSKLFIAAIRVGYRIGVPLTKLDHSLPTFAYAVA